MREEGEIHPHASDDRTIDKQTPRYEEENAKDHHAMKKKTQKTTTL